MGIKWLNTKIFISYIVLFIDLKLRFCIISSLCKLSTSVLIISDPRVLKVEGQTVLKPDQAEYVLSEGMLDSYLKCHKFGIKYVS